MTKIPVRRRPTQLTLFHPRSKPPLWNSLPKDAKQRVKSLLARLLQEHISNRLADQSGQEGPDE